MKKRILFLVESPNKVSTLRDILKEDDSATYIVKASVGHISKIKNSGPYYLGIDVNNNFNVHYEVIPDKKKIVDELKEQVKLADEVYLCSDPDREGERISYSLKQFLKIPAKKYKRITFHEITKNAIFKSIKEARDIDQNLTDASIARDAGDKIVGFRLSGLAKEKVGAKSVGRCQSACLKLIVQREEEIQNFKPEKYFDLFLHFKKNNQEFKAKYCNKKGEPESFKNLDDCNKIINSCIKDYSIFDIERKNQNENPQLPFTTASFQQEVIKKLGLTTEDAMNCAQKLFEGVELNGKHIALTTYLRTDDANMSPDFLPVLEEFVKKTYGEKYYSPVKKAKKSENAQEGHECFRVIDLEMTPEKLSKYISDEKLLKIYTIIYNRTIAASMKPAIYSTTKYIINNNNNYFVMNSKELVFDGYKKVYNYKDDNDNEEVVKETFDKNEILKNTSLETVEKETKPAPRYNEASLLKELEKQGIGRPSTFQSIIKTIKDEGRGYSTIVKKEIIPTELGIKLSHYLDEHFGDIININYTRELEKELDLIAQGSLDKITFLKDFYTKLDSTIKKVKNENIEVEYKCPHCGGPMKLRKGPYSYFYGCSNYPNCKYIAKLDEVKKI